MSTNKPSIGAGVLEIALDFEENCFKFQCFLYTILWPVCNAYFEKVKFEYFPKNSLCNLLNHWINTRLVCTHFNAFFMENPNVTITIWIFKNCWKKIKFLACRLHSMSAWRGIRLMFCSLARDLVGVEKWNLTVFSPNPHAGLSLNSLHRY